MTIHALASGKLFGVPETRVSKNGNDFTKATLVVVTGTERQFVTIFAFSETVRAELARLGEGDSLSVQGPLKAEVFERDGRSRVSLSMTVDHALALRQPPKERKPKSAPPATAVAPDRSRLARHAGDGVDEFGDDMPF